MAVVTQETIDEKIQQFYATAREAERLTARSAAGRLEFERTQQLLRRRLPTHSRIVDIGGATGIHAAWLAEDGHDVTLIDPVASQVTAAAAVGTFHAFVGDARRLDLADDSFDVALLFGPLYHLRSADDRAAALSEATRVVRQGGWVFAVGISRFSAVGAGMLTPEPMPADDRVLAIVNSGDWDASSYFPIAHMHTTTELCDELRAAGLADVETECIEGPLGLTMEFIAPGDGDEELHQAALLAAERLGAVPGAKETGPHLMAWGRVR